MPRGKVTRSTFFGSFSGSISTAATTTMPDSTRPSLPVKHTFLAPASWRQNLVQGENFNWGSCANACDVSTVAAATIANARTPLIAATNPRCLMGLPYNPLSSARAPTSRALQGITSDPADSRTSRSALNHNNGNTLGGLCLLHFGN